MMKCTRVQCMNQRCFTCNGGEILNLQPTRSNGNFSFEVDCNVECWLAIAYYVDYKRVVIIAIDFAVDKGVDMLVYPWGNYRTYPPYRCDDFGSTIMFAIKGHDASHVTDVNL